MSGFNPVHWHRDKHIGHADQLWSSLKLEIFDRMPKSNRPNERILIG